MVTNPAALSPDDTKALQTELHHAGFYSGAIDGKWGPASAAAWRLAQIAKLTGPILTSKDLDDAKRAEFARIWALADVLPADLAQVTHEAEQLLTGRDRYEGVASTTGVPWWMIGLIHGRECSYSFRQHLHNGDPLTARTVHVPAGRPASGHAPFDWSYSAADALLCDNFTTWHDWSLAGCLHKLEGYNGMGYRVRGIQTPYLWNMTAIGRPGKFVADGVFNAAATDEQAGCAAILKMLVARGAVTI